VKGYDRHVAQQVGIQVMADIISTAYIHRLSACSVTAILSSHQPVRRIHWFPAKLMIMSFSFTM
jgi:hypothetical protein